MQPGIKTVTNDLTFNNLIAQIRQIDERLTAQAGKAVNISLTLRNWFIGLYIAMFELNGADRAAYGEALLAELSKALRKHAVSNSGRRQLYNYLQFYRTYPQIVRTVSAQFKPMLPEELKRKTKVRTASAQLTIPPEKLLGCLSYSRR